MIRFDVELKVDGQRVSPDQWADALSRKVTQAAFQKVRSKVEGVRCPDHGSTPSFSEDQAAGNQESVTFACCCEKLKKAALEALKK
jgi:hypothetical protein